MRKPTNEETQNYFINPGLNQRKESFTQVRSRLEKNAALDALRNASSIAHLKPVLQWIIEQL